MRRGPRIDTRQIRNRLRDLQHAVIPTRRQPQPADRLLEYLLADAIRLRVLVDRCCRRAGARTCRPAEPPAPGSRGEVIPSFGKITGSSTGWRRFFSPPRSNVGAPHTGS
jgi:hypothetical protein